MDNKTDTVIRNATTGKDEAFQVVINNAKVQSNFKFEFKSDGDPSAFDMTIDVLREGTNDKMVTMNQYSNNLNLIIFREINFFLFSN